VQEARVPPKDLNIIFSPRPCTIWNIIWLR
jgi:hypothetical protein